MTLFDFGTHQPPVVPRCKHGRRQEERCPWCDQPPAQLDSPTSVAAAEQIKPSTATLRERVFRCIMACGPITDEGIQAALAMPGNTERPRRRELQELGRIIPEGTKPCASGRQAVAWVVAR